MPDFDHETVSRTLGIQLAPKPEKQVPYVPKSLLKRRMESVRPPDKPSTVNFDLVGQLLSGPFDTTALRVNGRTGRGAFLMLSVRQTAAPILGRDIDRIYKRRRILQVLSIIHK